MKREFRLALTLALFAIFGAGCATVSTPVLRHEIGESLGEKHFRFYGHLEMSRVFTPGAATDAQVAGIHQGNSVFQGSYFGIQAEGGVLPKLDLQLGANFSGAGGGWRAGAKYELLRIGRFAFAGMAGYGVSSASGDVTYLTATTPETVNLTLSAWTLDLSIPVSYHVATPVWIYSGPMYFHSGVSGSYGGAVASRSDDDIGLCLGVRVGVGMFVGDVEAAEVMVGDSFVGGNRLVPYIGMSFGVVL